MELMGQGLVLMVAGMGIVYVFLYVLIVVSNCASKFVSRFDYVIPDDSPRKNRRAVQVAAKPEPATQSPAAPVDGVEVKAPVPGTVLRISATDGQSVAEGEEILVMDVMKMETPITAPSAGRVSVKVSVMDKVATGDVVALVG